MSIADRSTYASSTADSGALVGRWCKISPRLVILGYKVGPEGSGDAMPSRLKQFWIVLRGEFFVHLCVIFPEKKM